MIRGELLIDQRRGLAESNRGIAAVVGWQFLFDDVGLEGNAEVVGLPRQVGRRVIIDPILFESIIAQVTPEDRGEPQVVCVFKRSGHFNDLSVRIFRAEVDGSPDGCSPHVEGPFYATEENLLVVVGVCEQFIVVDLDHKGNFVGVTAGDGSEHTERGGHGVAASFDGEFDDVLRIEIIRIGCKRSPGRMFNPLIDWQDRDISGPGESPGLQDPF